MKYIIPLMILFCLGLYLAGTLYRYHNTADIERHRAKEQTYLAIEEERARQKYWLAAAPIVSTGLLLLGFCGLVGTGVGAWQRHRVSLRRVWPRQGVVPIPNDDPQYTAIAVASLASWHQTERTRRLAAGYDLAGSTPLSLEELPQVAPPERSWRELASYPLLVVYGVMGSGKTTLVKALVELGGEYVVINPKRENWGCETIDTERGEDGFNFTAIQTTLKALCVEVVERTEPEHSRTPLTVVVDDTPQVALGAKEELAKLVLNVATIGRSLGFRLILVTQTDRVAHLGSKGAGDLTSEAPRVSCVKVGDSYRYVLREGDVESELGTSGLLDGANRPNNARAWSSPVIPLLCEGQSDSPTSRGGTLPQPEESPGRLSQDDIRTLLGSGIAPSAIVQDYLKGSRNKRWERVKAALGE